MESAEVLLDIADVPFVPYRSLRTTSVDKVKLSDSQRFVAFTLDIENNEIMTGGIKDCEKNEYLPYFVFKNVHTMEFGAGEDPRFLYYTESTIEHNRPWRVMRVDLKTSAKTVVYEDTDPTHYVDLGVTKDKMFLVISSNTKEDSEILVLPRGVDLEK
jgi:protease II